MFKEAIIRPPSFTNHSESTEWIHHNIATTGPKQYSFLLIPVVKISIDYLMIGIFDE